MLDKIAAALMKTATTALAPATGMAAGAELLPAVGGWSTAVTPAASGAAPGAFGLADIGKVLGQLKGAGGGSGGGQAAPAAQAAAQGPQLTPPGVSLDMNQLQQMLAARQRFGV